MQIDLAKRRKWLIFGPIVVLIVILAVSLGFLIHERIFSAVVNIMVVPSIAKVEIGDMEFPATYNVKIQPGEYTIKISAEGFADKTGKLIAKSDEAVNLSLYLDPNAEATLDWYDTHAEDALILGEIKNNETLEAVTKLLEKEPVLNQLPCTVEYYADDYSKHVKYIISYALNDSERGFYLIMKDYTGEGIGVAIQKLAEMGMNTVGLEMKYENLVDDTLNFRADM